MIPVRIRKIIYNSLNLIILPLVILISIAWVSSAASLNLSWDANTEDDLAGYKVYYGISSGNYGEPIDVGNATEYELSGLNDGTTYYIALTAYDTSNNESEKSNEVSGVAPDTHNPAITITSPTSSSTYSTSHSIITISGTASDNVGVTSVTWSNNRGGSGSASGTTSWSVASITLQEGDNVITVTAHDAAGNTATDTITVTYTPPDIQNPAITITSPTQSSTYSTENSIITISGTASDNVGVTSVTWSNNRGGSGSASGTTNWSVTSITLQEGDNVITVTAHDAAGNTATDTITVTYSPDMITVEYHSTDPVLILTGSVPEEGFMTINIPDNLDKALSSTLLLTLWDPDIAEEGYIYINDNDAIDLPVGDYDNLEHSFEISIDLDQIITGENIFRFTHISTMGYEVRALSIKITFTSYQDMTEPTIVINQPTSGSVYNTSNNTITISGTASDNLGVTSVTWSNNRGGSGSASGTTSWSVASTTLQEGDNVITVTAHDAAGNTATDTITVTYSPPDTQNPAITITSPTQSSTYSTENGTITISGTASDNVGVTTVTWSNNRGGSGSASGTTSWTISNIPLLCGKDNIITVTAEDAESNSATDTLIINVRPCKPIGLFVK